MFRFDKYLAVYIQDERKHNLKCSLLPDFIQNWAFTVVQFYTKIGMCQQAIVKLSNMKSQREHVECNRDMAKLTGMFL
jgi:hypothetical protein